MRKRNRNVISYIVCKETKKITGSIRDRVHGRRCRAASRILFKKNTGQEQYPRLPVPHSRTAGNRGCYGGRRRNQLSCREGGEGEGCVCMWPCVCSLVSARPPLVVVAAATTIIAFSRQTHLHFQLLSVQSLSACFAGDKYIYLPLPSYWFFLSFSS